MVNTGMFRLLQNEPVDIIGAYTTVRGIDALNSISVTKEKVKAVIRHYSTNFGQFPTGIINSNENVVSEFNLSQNYPNPFNPSTKISWQSPVGSWQTLKIFDVLGNEVTTFVDEYKPAGSYEVGFSAKAGLPSGVYFYQLKVGSFVKAKKMILLK